MTQTLYLLRHSHTADSEQGINGSRTDTPLSPGGWGLARSLVSKLAEHNYDLIIVSPLQRTRQTIEPYLQTLKDQPPVIVDPLTLERELGIFTNTVIGDGKIPADQKKWGGERTAWLPEGGESTVMVSQRARKFLEQLRQRPERSILICGHQNFLRCLELLIRNEPVDDEHYYSSDPPILDLGVLREYVLSENI